MKIALVNFPILDVGGITTWDEAIKIGYERLGHEVDRYYAKSGRSYSCLEDEKNFIGDKYKRGEILPGKFLSFRSDEVQASVETLNEYDLIHFIHPSPHPTKANMDTENPTGWADLYKNTTAKKIATMHDVNWAKTNLWYVLVAKHIDLLTGSQQPHFPAVESYPATVRKIWEYFPIDVKGLKVSHKRNPFGMVAHQWIKWKNHHKILKALEDFADCRIDLYGGGQEYHNLLKSGELDKFIGHNVVETGMTHDDYVGHVYHGFIARNELVEIYKKQLFSIDGSTKGYNNYTHFEPMLYGCISMVHEDVLAGEYNTIPEDCCVSFNWENLAEQIRYIKDNPDKMKKIRRKAFKFVKENFACEKVAKNILDALTAEITVRLATPEEFNKYAFEALEKYSFECWGQVDETEEEYENICKHCAWLEICTEYVKVNGKRPDEENEEQEEKSKGKENEDVPIDKPIGMRGELIEIRGAKVLIDFENRSIMVKY